MIILACETSTLLGSVALVEDGQLLAQAESMRQGSHSDVLNNFIQEVLDRSGKHLTDVDVFATGCGPGSFTGIRICLNTIKTLAYCHDKPVFAANSLVNLATAAAAQKKPKEFENIPLISMINAYKNMVYVAKYRASSEGLEELCEPQVLRVQSLGQILTEESLICGDGYTAYSAYLSEEMKKLCRRLPENISDEPHALNLALMADRELQTRPSTQNLLQWHELLPLYLRQSEAEENLKGIKYQPLI